MDIELQARLEFLEEAIEYCDQLESSLLGIADTGIDSQKLDAAARAAHSIKGGAAMMGFKVMTHTAHSLEDYLKILQARFQGQDIDPQIEILLLQGVDCLREIGTSYRQGNEPQQEWFEKYITSTFDPLHKRLGDLTEADETALLSKEEGTNVADLLFGSGVEECLARLKSQLKILPPDELAEHLNSTAEELADFGRMIECEEFIGLCESVKAYLAQSPPEEVNSLTRSAIAQWERSQALIQLGRYNQLPNTLDSSEITAEDNKWDEIEIPNLDDFDPAEFADLQAEFDFPDLEKPEGGQEEDFFAMAVQESIGQDKQTLEVELESSKTPIPEDTTVRVSVEQLARINTLFSRLILEREMLNSRIRQLEEFVRLSKSRTDQLETANKQLRKWYDKLDYNSIAVSNLMNTQTEGFDTLEMDRYSDLHLLFQEQMETIVQLQEVTSDIEVSSREVTQAMGNLNFTTSDLQRGITRVQTRPFSEAVKGTRRMIRDLSLQYDKPVTIKIQGENTLIDRAAFEALTAPLNHLLRNAFDHGIEDSETRKHRGKPEQGTITLNAVNQGNKTIISISDDGGGIDRDKIKACLRKMGKSDQELGKMSDQALLNSIFTPGFSTAEQVTELSGRGVGMDVVRTNLEKIRGEIYVDTKLGAGTTFRISFPLSVSIARVAIVESQGLVFALPAEIIQAFAPHNEFIEESGTMLWSEGEIPVVGLERWIQFNRAVKPFAMEGMPTLDRPTVLIVDAGDHQQGFKVDRFWREQEVALRSVDSPLPLPVGIMGSTVLGDGRPIPLVDPMQLLSGENRSKILATENIDDYRFDEENITEEAIFDLIDRHRSTTEEDTILIIDDSIHVRRYLAIALEKAGYQVEQARDGQEAIEKVFSGLPIKAAICDIEMPRLDGYGVLEEIKGHPKYKKLPIAMLTSRGNEKHRQLAMKLGATAYFSKPYNEQELLTTLASMINSQ